jgi:nitroreductase
MLGIKRKYHFCPALVSLKGLDFPVVAIGCIKGAAGHSIWSYANDKAGVLERLFVKDDHIDCYQAVGISSNVGLMYNFIKENKTIHNLNDMLQSNSLDIANYVRYESLLELVKRRRSTRTFKPDPIPDHYVDKIIEVARWAPSGANSQPWEFIVVKKQKLKDSIVKLYEEYSISAYKMELTREKEKRFPTFSRLPQKPPGFATAPVFIIMLGDPRTKSDYPLSTSADRGESTYTSSLASSFLYMHMAATTLGLGSQWVSGTRNPFVQCLIKQLLAVPDKLEIYDMMAVGHPASESNPRIVRDREDLVHFDYYDEAKFRTDE